MSSINWDRNVKHQPGLDICDNSFRCRIHLQQIKAYY